MKLQPLVIAVMAALAPAAAVAQTPQTAPSSGSQVRPPPEVDRSTVQGLTASRMPVIDALRDEGMFHFAGTKVTHLRLAGPARGDRFPLAEIAEEPLLTAFNSHLDAGTFVVNGERHRFSPPDYAVPAADGTAQVVYAGRHPLRLRVWLEAYDVSGRAILPFLRTARAYAMPDSARAGDRTFPPGSTAYIVHATFLDDVLVLPGREAFSGATTTRAFVANFSRSIPYCLPYEGRDGAKPYAVLFRDAQATRGRTTVYRAKPDVVFCASDGGEPVAEGQWEEVRVAGTRAVVLKFGNDIDPQDTGVSDTESAAALPAFIEPRVGAPGVRPGKMYRAGATIVDHQFRFNAAAAQAIRAALAPGG
jgi:hypothetical protein